MRELSTSKLFAAKTSKIESDVIFQNTNFKTEVTLYKNYHDQSIVKFYGYSMKDLEGNDVFATLVLEYAKNDALGEMLKLEQNLKKREEWTATKKLICIFE